MHTRNGNDAHARKANEILIEQGETGEGLLPYEYFYKLLDEEDLKQHYQIPIEDSWVYAAKKKKLKIYSPGTEDSTLGNMFVAR